MSTIRETLETPAEFLDRMRSVGVISKRTGSTVREGRRADGVRVKATTDELGHTVTEHNVPGGRQDVLLRPQTVKIKIGAHQG
jgi:hypothetical protein